MGYKVSLESVSEEGYIFLNAEANRLGPRLLPQEVQIQIKYDPDLENLQRSLLYLKNTNNLF